MRKHIGAVSLYFSIAVLSTAIVFISPGALLAAGAGQRGSLHAVSDSALNGPGPHPAASRAKMRVLETYWRLPLYFIANRGQVNGKALFYATGPGHATFFTRKGIVVGLSKVEGKGTGIRHGAAAKRALLGKSPAAGAGPIRSSYLRIGMPGMSKDVQIEPQNVQPGKVNYFVGKDPRTWRTGIPTYGAVLYKNAYPGIDLRFYGNNRRLEYDIIVKPGANPSKIRFKYSGAKDVHVTPAGDLAIELSDGRLVMKKPDIYQELDGRRVFRQGKFKVRQVKPANTVSEASGKAAHTGAKLRTYTCSFEVGAYDRKIPLVIDPVLVYSTYLGGSGDDTACAVAVDGSGNAYVAGQTASTGYFDSGYQSTFNGGSSDAFVTEIAPGGQSMVYSTYLGGNGADTAFGIAVDGSGNAYVAGETLSANFPTRKALYSSLTGGEDAFVTEIAAGGQSLVYSTYLGGNGIDAACFIALDSSGNAYVTGATLSSDFPTRNAVQTAYKGGSTSGDAFVTEIAPGGQSLVYSTYLGGSGDDSANSIAVDSSGNAYVAGWTESSDFPTSNPYQSSHKGSTSYDAFVAEIAAGGRSLVYSTYLGGSVDDVAYGIAVDGSGNAYVTGWTDSSDFPTHKALYSSLTGGVCAFVTEIAAGGQSLVYSTYLGGSNKTWGTGIALDSSGDAYVTGETLASDFPTAGSASQSTYAGGTNYGDVFLTEIAPGGQSLVLSTYLGGSADERALGIAVDTWGDAFVAGDTISTDFPIANALQGNNGGGDDAFLAEFAGLWRNAKSLGSGWMWSRWFGYFAVGDTHWIFNDTLGWLYAFGTSTNGIWFYDPRWDNGQGGWWWTSTLAFPYLYSASEGAWFFYDTGTSNPRWFCNLKTGQWVKY